MSTNGPPWKVGELARRTGLTVRTLHHYDEIGLLSPSVRSGSGHRLYSDRDVERLQQIASLRELGFALAEIRACLADPAFSPRRLVRAHLERVEGQMDRLSRLRNRLDRLADRLEKAEVASVDEVLAAIQEMTMFEKYYTPEQLEQLKQRAEAIGPDRIAEVEAEWPRLIAEVQSAMDRGADPNSAEVRELARRWMGLVREFTGGDPGISASLKNLWKGESVVHGMETGPMRGMLDFLGPAMEAEREKS
jgi:DNA-binding transcriptional MerR regulator